MLFWTAPGFVGKNEWTENSIESSFRDDATDKDKLARQRRI